MWDATATTLAIRAWSDPVVDARGFGPNSAYVEWAWLPILGPTATWAYRRLATGLDASPAGYELDVGELARSLSEAGGSGSNASILRTTARLVAFGLARWDDDGALAVLRKAPPVPGWHLRSRTPGVHRSSDNAA